MRAKRLGQSVLRWGLFCALVLGVLPIAARSEEPRPYRWVSTYGPPGGLGYDTRIDPRNPNIVFTTDQWAGICKSYDGGYTWYPRNEGIDSRFGPSLDSVPIFCCTIDPYDSDVVWCGTFGMRGVFKSVDGGETWTRKDHGIPDLEGMSFRSFSINPADTDIVYTGVEVPVIGENRSRGKIFKTVDGGENWFEVLDCDALIRHIVIDPVDPEVVYAASGIFDRGDVRPEGILKTVDGGKMWFPVNNGIENLVVGGLTMHPEDHLTLYCATGRHEGFGGGPNPRHGKVLKTTDGGEHWTPITEGYYAWNAVEVSRSNPEIMYASTEHMFARSYDGGETWETLPLGLPGVYSGVPITITIDPFNPDKVFVNSYTGGLYLSLDGGQSWMNAMNGFTGAEMTDISMDPNNPSVVFAVGRPGPFKSYDGGLHWLGTGFIEGGTQPRPEWSAVCVNPEDPNIVLAADQFYGELYKTEDSGRSWRIVLRIMPQDQVEYPRSLHGLKTIVYAPSDPSIVYAGARIPDKTIEFDRTTPFDTTRPSLGIYRSVDGGETWVQINDGLEKTTFNINQIAVDPDNPQIAYAATLNSGIFKTVDGGQHWVSINQGITRNDIRSICIDPARPNVIYAGAENAGIFKSDNGGLAWKQVNYGLDAEATIRDIVIDPLDTDRVYAGDWHTGVYVTENGGRLWRHINDGLENRAVTALSISADGRVLYAATQGGGVFRLGQVATTATVCGRVTEAVSGDAIPEALVSLASTDFSTRTDADGRFELSGLAPGVFDLEVSAATYIPYEKHGIFLVGGQTKELHVELCRRLYPALTPEVNGSRFAPGDVLKVTAHLENKGPSVYAVAYLALQGDEGILFFDGLWFSAELVGFPIFVMSQTDLTIKIAEVQIPNKPPVGRYTLWGIFTLPDRYEPYSLMRSTSFEIIE